MKDIDKMTKDELRFELDNLRDDYKHLKLMNDIVSLILKFPTSIELEKVKTATEKAYNESLKDWGFWYGMRDNIVKMAEMATDSQNIDELQYLNMFMFCTLLDNMPEIVDGIPFMTDNMKKYCFERMQEKKKDGVAV